MRFLHDAHFAYSSTPPENDFYLTLFVLQRDLRWDAQDVGASHLTVTVRAEVFAYSPLSPYNPLGQALVADVMSGVLRPHVPLLMHVVVSSLGVLMLWDRSQFSTNPTCRPVG